MKFTMASYDYYYFLTKVMLLNHVCFRKSLKLGFVVQESIFQLFSPLWQTGCLEHLPISPVDTQFPCCYGVMWKDGFGNLVLLRATRKQQRKKIKTCGNKHPCALWCDVAGCDGVWCEVWLWANNWRIFSTAFAEGVVREINVLVKACFLIKLHEVNQESLTCDGSGRQKSHFHSYAIKIALAVTCSDRLS